MTGSNGGCVHMSCGPSGTTSTCACRISERPFSSRGRWMPTTMGASECSSEKVAPPGCREIASVSIAKRSIASPRSRNARKTKSWIACSSPRSERKRTRSCVKAICSARPCSTEAMMRSRRFGSRVIGLHLSQGFLSARRMQAHWLHRAVHECTPRPFYRAEAEAMQPPDAGEGLQNIYHHADAEGRRHSNRAEQSKAISIKYPPQDDRLKNVVRECYPP